MKYTFDVYQGDARVDTFTRIEELDRYQGEAFDRINITHNASGLLYLVLKNPDDIGSFVVSQERSAAWKPEKTEPYHTLATEAVKTAVNPKHHKNFIDELQWIDAISRMPRYRDPVAFKAAVELQVRKYLDRNGRKDNELQEYMKAKWYLDYLCAYIKNGETPILGVDVKKILES